MEPVVTSYGAANDADKGAAFPRMEKEAKELPIKKHEALLCRIARGFGFSEGEARLLVEQVCACAREQVKTRSLPFRIWLCRLVVRQCVFRIGSELFRQSGCSTERDLPSSLDYYYRYRNAGELLLQEMPLSFRAVYILSGVLQFTEAETAEILNTTLYKVRERHQRALAFLSRVSVR